jgi:hypothetical protein
MACLLGQKCNAHFCKSNGLRGKVLFAGCFAGVFGGNRQHFNYMLLIFLCFTCRTRLRQGFFAAILLKVLSQGAA